MRASPLIPTLLFTCALACDAEDASHPEAVELIDLSIDEDAVSIADLPDSGSEYGLMLDDPNDEVPVAIPLPVLTSLKLWLRADAGVNVNQNGVYRWDDQSPWSNNATQNTTTALPEIVYQALNGYPVLRFDGDDFHVLNSKLQLLQHTIFVVAKSTKPNAGYHMILGAGGDTPNTQFRFENSTSVLFAGLGNGMPIIMSPTGNNKVWHTMSVSYNGNTWKVRRDGQLKSTHNFVVNGTWDLRAVGAWFSKHHLVGDLAEIIVYDRCLSDAEITSVQGYLSAKYALPGGGGGGPVPFEIE